MAEPLSEQLAGLRLMHESGAGKLAQLSDRVEHLDECLDDAKQEMKNVKERLFGSEKGIGELAGIRADIRALEMKMMKVLWIAIGAGFVVEFLFGSGLFSLNTLVNKHP